MSWGLVINSVGMRRRKDVYAIAKRSDLCLTIFNFSTADKKCSHKLLCLSASIVGIFFLIELTFVQPTLSLFFVVVANNSMTFVIVVPECRDYFRCISRSIPNICFKVGGFRGIERDSSLIFLDFVLNCALSLLLM